MEQILNNMTDPEWWFTGLFFAIFIKLMPFIGRHFKVKIRMFFRKKRLERIQFIRENRGNLAAVNFQSSRSQAFFVVFMMVCSLYIVWFSVGPLFQILQKSLAAFILCLIPMIIFEIFWILQEDKAKELITHYKNFTRRRENSQNQRW